MQPASPLIPVERSNCWLWRKGGWNAKRKANVDVFVSPCAAVDNNISPQQQEAFTREDKHGSSSFLKRMLLGWYEHRGPNIAGEQVASPWRLPHGIIGSSTPAAIPVAEWAGKCGGKDQSEFEDVPFLQFSIKCGQITLGGRRRCFQSEYWSSGSLNTRAQVKLRLGLLREYFMMGSSRSVR